MSPSPHTVAAGLIAAKPVLTSDAFRQLLPELQARAFTIAGVTSVDALARCRDMIATLPEGADWDVVKKDVVAEISPYLVTSDDPEEAAQQQAAAVAKAELLLRTHGFAAYEAAHMKELQAQSDIFPYWMWQDMDDQKVRRDHRAMHHVIAPWDDPLWERLSAKREWGCRCKAVGMMQMDIDRIAADDATKPLAERRILSPEVRARLAEFGVITRPRFDDRTGKPIPGTAIEYNIADHAMSKATLPVGTLVIPIEDLRARYANDPAAWRAFATWANRQRLPSDTRTVWQWATGVQAPPQPLPLASVSPPQTAPGMAKPGSVSELLARLGVQDVQTHVFTEAEASALKGALLEAQPAQVQDVTTSVRGNTRFPAPQVTEAAQRLLDMVPPALAQSLPPIKIALKAMADSLGTYNAGSHELNIASQITSESEFRRVICHELVHWLHMHGPQSYRDAIQQLFRSRTHGAKDPVVQLSSQTGVPYRATGMEDDWADIIGNNYAGRIYPDDAADPTGSEVPTRHLEKLSGTALNLMEHLNHRSLKTGAYSWREAFFTALQILFP